jgi:hypothetical protein
MIVIGLTQQVSTDSELQNLTGMANRTIVYHTVNQKPYIYESKFGNGYISSVDGGYWVEDNIKCLDLQEYKELRYDEIDARTEEKIQEGFAYAGKVFSLSGNAQINILGLDNTRNDPALTYPIEYTTINDDDNYFVADSSEMHTMYLIALATKKNWVDSGTILKDSIRAATTDIDVQNIIDNR